jgi:predicted alpha/beta-fold hydrolase
MRIREKQQKHVSYLQSHYLKTFGVDWKHEMKTSTGFVEYESRIVAISGQPTLDEYCRLSSSQNHIPQITIPTMILQAEDDPITGGKALDREVCRNNPHILLGITEKGGHCGYYQNIFSSRQWFVKPIFEFLNFQVAQGK